MFRLYFLDGSEMWNLTTVDLGGSLSTIGSHVCSVSDQNILQMIVQLFLERLQFVLVNFPTISIFR